MRRFSERNFEQLEKNVRATRALHRSPTALGLFASPCKPNAESVLESFSSGLSYPGPEDLYLGAQPTSKHNVHEH